MASLVTFPYSLPRPIRGPAGTYLGPTRRNPVLKPPRRQRPLAARRPLAFGAVAGLPTRRAVPGRQAPGRPPVLPPPVAPPAAALVAQLSSNSPISPRAMTASLQHICLSQSSPPCDRVLGFVSPQPSQSCATWVRRRMRPPTAPGGQHSICTSYHNCFAAITEWNATHCDA